MNFELEAAEDGRYVQADNALTVVRKLSEEVTHLKHLLSVSEDYRRAYQEGKYKLYAMGGEICEAAADCLPMSEGPLDRAVRKALTPPAQSRKEMRDE
jgi:hypothetical protein